MTHPDEGTLYDLVDGELASNERRAIANHLATCGQCRDAVAALRRLKDRARGLAIDLDPPESEWMAIRGRIVAHKSAGDARDRAAPTTWVSPRRLGWAAAVVLAAGLSWSLVGGPDGAPLDERGDALPPTAEGADRGGSPGSVVPAAVVEEAYGPTVQALEQMLRESRDRLDPETARIVDENLAIIEEAIERVSAVLEEDGAGAPLRALDALYQSKIRLLRRAAAIPQEI